MDTDADIPLEEATTSCTWLGRHYALVPKLLRHAFPEMNPHLEGVSEDAPPFLVIVKPFYFHPLLMRFSVMVE
jgi:hypothetical protein